MIAVIVAVDLGVIALDVPARLQCPDTAPARRRRKPHPLRQFSIGEARIRLQFFQDRQVELIDAFHKRQFSA